MIGIRGATTVAANVPSDIRRATREVLDGLLERNGIGPDDLVACLFTVTPDLNALYPSTVAREAPGWERVPLLDMAQAVGPIGPALCIRVLLLAQSDKRADQVVHLYLHGAGQLRPDLAYASEEGSTANGCDHECGGDGRGDRGGRRTS